MKETLIAALTAVLDSSITQATLEQIGSFFEYAMIPKASSEEMKRALEQQRREHPNDPLVGAEGKGAVNKIGDLGKELGLGWLRENATTWLQKVTEVESEKPDPAQSFAKKAQSTAKAIADGAKATIGKVGAAVQVPPRLIDNAAEKVFHARPIQVTVDGAGSLCSGIAGLIKQMGGPVGKVGNWTITVTGGAALGTADAVSKFAEAFKNNIADMKITPNIKSLGDKKFDIGLNFELSLEPRPK